MLATVRDAVPAGVRDRVRTMSPRARLFTVLLVVYVALTLAVLLRSPVLDLDKWVVHLQLRRRYHGWLGTVRTLVDFGQRRPVTQGVLPFLVLVAFRTRSARPLVTLVVALVVLNLSVGIVKLSTGRMGPRGGHPVDQIFAGGDIYPSGHVANTVVMYGLVAMFVMARLRAAAVAGAVLIAITVGAGTLYLKTHWLTDVVGGWLAGGLVLCSLPWLTPWAERIVARSFSRTRAAVSVVLGAVSLYVNLPLGFLFGGWVNSVYGGWLAAGLVFSIVPWLTPPLERRLRQAFAQRRAPRPGDPIAVVGEAEPAVLQQPAAAPGGETNGVPSPGGAHAGPRGRAGRREQRLRDRRATRAEV